MRYWEQDSTTAVLKFYGYINEWYNNASDFESTIRDIAGKYQNLIIKTHCYGGSVFEGSVMFNCLQRTPLNVTVDIQGVSASMMSIVMLAAKKVIIAPNGFVMIHCPSGFTEGNAAEMFATAKLLKSMEKNFANAYKKKTGAKDDVIAGWFDGTDHWFDAEEAKTLGLVDEVYEDVVIDVEDNYKPDATTPIIQLYNRFAAVAKMDMPVNEVQNSTPNNLNMKKDLISRLGLTGVNENSSDTAVIEAAYNRLAEMTNKVTNLEAAAKTQAEALVKGTIERIDATLTTKFTDAQKAQLKTVGEKAGIEALELMAAFITPAAPAAPANNSQQIVDITGALQPTVKTAQGSATGNGVAADKATWDWDKWQKEDPDGIEALAVTNYAAFNALYKAKYKVDAPK